VITLVFKAIFFTNSMISRFFSFLVAQEIYVSGVARENLSCVYIIENKKVYKRRCSKNSVFTEVAKRW